MNKIFYAFLIFSFLVFLAAGCSWVQTMQSNSNVEDKTRDTLGLKKTGIAECDAVVEILSKKSKGNTKPEDESWFDKAKTELIKQQIYDYVNSGNKTPKEKAEMTENCKTVLGYIKEEPKTKK
jgi:hypothetical protein